MPYSLMELQIFSFHEDLTTFRARTDATPERRVSGETKYRIYHHSTLIAARESPERHSSKRSTNGRIR